MLFVSCDGYGKQAEYMRHGMDFDQLVSNTRKFLSETVHSSVTFINTFNVLSIPSLKDFLQMILDLRKEFGGKNAIDRFVEVEPTHGVNHPPFRQVVEPFQRIWFDIPVLRYPNWFMIQNSGQEGIEKIKEIISFMEDNVQDENYHKTFKPLEKEPDLHLGDNEGDQKVRTNKIKAASLVDQEELKKLFEELLEQEQI
jgi:hypothetical protein